MRLPGSWKDCFGSILAILVWTSHKGTRKKKVWKIFDFFFFWQFPSVSLFIAYTVTVLDGETGEECCHTGLPTTGWDMAVSGLLQRVGGGSLSYHKISHYSAQTADGNIYLALCGAWVKSAFRLYLHTAALVNGHCIVKCTILQSILKYFTIQGEGVTGHFRKV